MSSIIALIFLLLALLIVISALWPNWNFSGGPVITPNRIIGCIIALIVLFVLYLLVVALFGGGVRPLAGAPFLAGFALVGSVTPTASDTNGSSGVGSYNLAWYAAWVNAAIGVVAGVLAAAYLAAHPSWLSADIAGTCGIIVPITVGLAALLPQITRTPSARAASYLQAAAGVLPPDLAEKHPVVATTGARSSDTL